MKKNIVMGNSVVYMKEFVFTSADDVVKVVGWLDSNDVSYVKVSKYILRIPSDVCQSLFSSVECWGEYVCRPFLLDKYPDKVLLGVRSDGEKIYLSRPSWDCNWYWGFGYLGNKDCHYHVSSLESVEELVCVSSLVSEVLGELGYGALTSEVHSAMKERGVPFVCHDITKVNIFDGFKKHFEGGSFIVTDEKDLWQLCELFKSFYKLREMSDFFHRGGAWVSDNPFKVYLQDHDKENEINYFLLPKVFDGIYGILRKYIS